MRLLIFLLALMSAFFIPKSFSVELDMENLVPPKQESSQTYSCAYRTSWGPSYSSIVQASDNTAAFEACSIWGINNITRNQPCGEQSVTSVFYGQFSLPLNRQTSEGECKIGAQGGGTVKFTPTDLGIQDSETCPPDNSPEHIYTVDDNGRTMCAKELEVADCPAGYHSKNVSRALGSSECVPKDCPEIGSGTSLSSSKMTGGVPFSGGGMYCNDGCAYSVPESNITSQNYALGVSQGAACGDKPYDNKKLSELDDGSKCELNTNGDVDVLFCSDPATPPDGTEPPKPDDPIAPVDNDDLKKDNTKTPDKPLLNCSNEDVACQIENLKIQAENDAKNLREDQVDRFNNALDADTRNTNAIIGAIEAFHTTVYIADQKADTYQLLAQSQIERLITTVENGSATGGGSGGDDTGTGGGGGGVGGGGSGTGTGEGDGEPCEGSAADCVPVEGSELSVEQINLDQYADKYDDWLRDAELPTEKCITLTTGRSICLSFEYYIIFFQAISGLIVMAGLLHSGRIISGAI